MRPQLKICGLMRGADVALCCGMGVDICGFVVEYPLDVPWNLTREACRRLLAETVSPVKSCLVTGGAMEQIHALALELRPDLVQLHFHETLADTAALVQSFRPMGLGLSRPFPFPQRNAGGSLGRSIWRSASGLCAAPASTRSWPTAGGRTTPPAAAFWTSIFARGYVRRPPAQWRWAAGSRRTTAGLSPKRCGRPSSM